MLLELICALWILAFSPQDQTLGVVGFALLVGIWISTAWVQSRQHGQLRHGYNANLLDQLVQRNRLRLLCWWTRLAVAILLLQAHLPPGDPVS